MVWLPLIVYNPQKNTLNKSKHKGLQPRMKMYPLKKHTDFPLSCWFSGEGHHVSLESPTLLSVYQKVK